MTVNKNAADIASDKHGYRAERVTAGWLKRLKDYALRNPFSCLVTVLGLWLVLMLLPAVFDWLIFSARFSASNAQECRDIRGACWAFIAEKHRLILFGLYPYDEQWRPLLALVILLGTILLSGWRALWNRNLIVVWVVSLSIFAVLMWGGVWGLSYVDNEKWGGLPLTLMLATFGIAFAFPIGVLLALGRRSTMPVIKALSVVYIELIRGVPLISLLFMASVMLPLFLPEGMSIDKLLRAQIAIIMFTAAYIAETLRGGLQAIPKGQFEAADALGLTYWQQVRKIVLPQALTMVIGPLVSIFISLFKDTSLVVVIGIFDLTLAAKAAIADAAWRGFSLEAYVFIGVIYFVFCFSLSKYSQSLERRLLLRR